jgi:hypothetical protein
MQRGREGEMSVQFGHHMSRTGTELEVRSGGRRWNHLNIRRNYVLEDGASSGLIHALAFLSPMRYSISLLFLLSSAPVRCRAAFC